MTRAAVDDTRPMAATMPATMPATRLVVGPYAVAHGLGRARGTRVASVRTANARDRRVSCHGWHAGRLSTPRPRVSVSALGDTDRAAPTRWIAAPRGPYRGTHGAAPGIEPHHLPRAVLRSREGRDQTKTGTGGIPYPDLRDAFEASRRRLEQNKPSLSVFERAGGFVYIRNFFAQQEFEVIKAECALLRTSVGSERRACARQRLGVMVAETNLVHRAFMNDRVAHRLGEIVGQETLMPADVPVEYRVYPEGSAMDWHQDVALYKTPQYELVFTLENTSDSQVRGVAFPKS